MTHRARVANHAQGPERVPRGAPRLAVHPCEVPHAAARHRQRVDAQLRTGGVLNGPNASSCADRLAGVLSGAMTCAHGRTPIDRYRPQAVYWGAPWRAAASARRAAERSSSPSLAPPESTAASQTAQEHTKRASEAPGWRPATRAEEAEADRLRKEFPELSV
jgi:hypothetical protein